MAKVFSERNNLRRAVPIEIRGDAPERFRQYAFDAIKHFYPYESLAPDFVHVSLGKLPPDVSRSRYAPGAWDLAHYAIFEAPWFKVYDLIELFYAKLRGAKDKEPAMTFLNLTNTFFEDFGYAYRLESQGDLVYRGDEAFESAVGTAKISLESAGLVTAAAEIHEALQDLIKRPSPDLTGAIQHAIAGLECAANQVSGESGFELGRLLKKRQDLFPQPLGTVLSQMYGYASNNGRHLNEGQEPDFAEAELIVGVAATAATYLARKLNP
jgi:hypothetical protein